MGAELFHADGQTDMTKLIVAFRNFANAPKKSWKLTHLAGNKCRTRLGQQKYVVGVTP